MSASRLRSRETSNEANLRCEKEVFTSEAERAVSFYRIPADAADAELLESIADERLVRVDGGRIDVAVAYPKRRSDRLLDFLLVL